LVLALVFVVIVGGLIASLATLILNDVNNGRVFASVRNLQYAATSAADYAIQEIRYTPDLSSTLNASPPGTCFGNASFSDVTNIDGVAQEDAWCSTTWTPTSAATRTVTVSICSDNGGSAASQAVACAASPYLQAVVVFDDYPAGTNAPATTQCQVYCGTGMTVTSWAWSPPVPTLTSLNGSTTGPSNGGNTLTLTGTGFVSGSKVSFLEESGGVPTSDNTLVAATTVTYVSSTSLTVTVPGVTVGTTYFVLVSTPTGTSPQNLVYTYSEATPTVTSMTPNAGPTSGGTQVTLTGTGFFSGAQVIFEQESGSATGQLAASPALLQASNEIVTSSTSMTALVPSTIVGQYYLAVVVNPGALTSALTTNAQFSFDQFVPLVVAVSPSTGTSGTVVTITGVNFYTGTTVNFVPVSSGTSYNNVTPISGSISSTTLKVALPSGISAVSYYVTVNVPNLAGGSNTSATSTFAEIVG
jgi:hypothetical protein